MFWLFYRIFGAWSRAANIDWLIDWLSYRPVSIGLFLLELDHEKSAVESVGKREFLVGVGVDVNASLLVEDLGLDRFVDIHPLLCLGVNDSPDDVRSWLNDRLDRDQSDVLASFRCLLRCRHFHLKTTTTITTRRHSWSSTPRRVVVLNANPNPNLYLWPFNPKPCHF